MTNDGTVPQVRVFPLYFTVVIRFALSPTTTMMSSLFGSTSSRTHVTFAETTSAIWVCAVQVGLGWLPLQMRA